MSQTPRLISMKVVQQLTSYSRTHISRLEAVGKFPKRVRLSRHPRGRMGVQNVLPSHFAKKKLSATSTRNSGFLLLGWSV